MSLSKPLIDPKTEYILDEGWLLLRKFMQEIEAEFDIQGKIPTELLLTSTNLQKKWLEFARKN